MTTDTLTKLAIAVVVPNPLQPRRYFDEAALAELRHSIESVGLLNPIQVTPAGDDGRHQIIDGERRFRAVCGLEWTHVDAIVRDVPAERIFEQSVVANFAREDMTEIETALAIRKLCDERGLSVPQVARMIGRSDAWAYNMLKYLNLDGGVVTLLASRKCTPKLAQDVASYPKSAQLGIVQAVQAVVATRGRNLTPQETTREVKRAAERLGVARTTKGGGANKRRTVTAMLAQDIATRATQLGDALDELIEKTTPEQAAAIDRQSWLDAAIVLEKLGRQAKRAAAWIDEVPT